MELSNINKIASLSKKEITKQAEEQINLIINEGFQDPLEALVLIKRIKDYVDLVEKGIRKNYDLKESVELFGAKVSKVSGRKMVQYKEDQVYETLEQDLKNRKDLLDLALKSNKQIFDDEGVEIPKVSVKYASDSINIKY